MTAKQRNQLAMLMAVNKVFTDYVTEISSIPALVKLISDFPGLLARIQEVHQIQQGLKGSNSALKVKEEAEMVEATVAMAAAIYVYAQINELPALMEKCDVSPHHLEKMADETLLVTCRNVYDEAVKLDGALTDFGKDPESITQLGKEIDDFAAIITAPRSAVVTRSQATKELAKLVREANDLLRKKVDKLMGLLEKTHPVVYNSYKAARVIVDLRKGKRTEEEE
jgi:hypothetical protein